MRDRGKPARLLLFDVRESFFGWDGRSPVNLPFPLIFSAAYGSFFKKGRGEELSIGERDSKCCFFHGLSISENTQTDRPRPP